ncbi:MAG TPA: GNAT family N-acetyltransferase [Ktedonobacterales bacterium]|nr:GNAT family N-acetyltransferase [Ktedonobacterales bacterium]
MATIRELGPAETHLAYPAALELRPHLSSLEAFVQQVNEDQRPEGYRLLGSFEDGVEDAAAIAGFRTGHMLSRGHFLYIDDLGTRAAFRRRGHGAGLMEWVIAEAQRLGCVRLHLDSGVHRHDAHRLYLNQRMDIMAHHFYRDL